MAASGRKQVPQIEGEGAGVLMCAEVAFELKWKLDAAGLQSFAKVSGSKGMPLYVPLHTAVTYDDTQPYAKSLAQELEREGVDSREPSATLPLRRAARR